MKGSSGESFDVSYLASVLEDVSSLKQFKQQMEHLTREMQSSLRAVDETLSVLVSQKVNIPTLFCLMPVKRNLWDTICNPTTSLFSNSFMLMVICPVTLKVVPRSSNGGELFNFMSFF